MNVEMRTDQLHALGRVVPAISAALWLMGPAHAQISWINPSGGSYVVASNWSPNNVPDTSIEGAIFALDETYTVGFPSADVSALLASITDGNVTWDLDFGGTAQTYTFGSLTINRTPSSGQSPVLTVRDGFGIVRTQTLQVANGGELHVTNTAILDTWDGNVTVSGEGSTWTDDNPLRVGDSGMGNLTVEMGGRIETDGGTIGFDSGSTGATTITGAGSTWASSGPVTIGRSGSGMLTIEAGGRMENEDINHEDVIGLNSGSNGAVTVTGADSIWTSRLDLVVGKQGVGMLTVANGASINNDAGPDGIIGDEPGSSGTVTVTGIGSKWIPDVLWVGRAGEGTLTIADGASVPAVGGLSTVGEESTSNGTVLVTGAGSTWMAGFTLAVGIFGDGTLTIADGGAVETDEAGIATASGSSGTITVTGADSALTTSREITVGRAGEGVLKIETGGRVENKLNEGTDDVCSIGDQPGSSGTATVTGADSIWTVSGQLWIGGEAATGENGGAGTLSILESGTVDVADGVTLFADGAIELAGGMLVTPAVHFEGGGQFEWSSGILHVDTFHGNVTNQGGTLAPGRSAGTTAIVGNYNQEFGAALEIELGGTDAGTGYDFLDVAGTAALQGTLEVALIDGFVPDPEDEFVIVNAGVLLDSVANVGEDERVETSDGLGSFLVEHRTGIPPLGTSQLVLTDFQFGENPPVILSQVAGQTVTAGGEVVLSIEAVGRDPVTYQWYRDGVAIPGATESTYKLPSVQAFHAGEYTVVVTNPFGEITSEAASLAVEGAAPSDARLLNLSTRALALTGSEVLIPGFVVTGTESKRLLIRAVGPTLGMSPFNLSGVLPDPQMVLKRWNGASYDDVVANDNWVDNANAADIQTTAAELFAFGLQSDNEAALLVDLAPGQYTVVADGVDNATGLAIVELWDADDDTVDARLLNISNRGFVGTGAEVMIPGFVVSEEGPKTFLIRVVGPTLANAPFNVPGTMDDPKLDVYRSEGGGVNTLLFTQDDWSENPDAANTAATADEVFAFDLPDGSADAAFVVTLEPGAYTVIGSAADGVSTGVLLVEIYVVE